MADDVEFWPLKVVVQKVGLSKTEIYRRADAPDGRNHADGMD